MKQYHLLITLFFSIAHLVASAQLISWNFTAGNTPIVNLPGGATALSFNTGGTIGTAGCTGNGYSSDNWNVNDYLQIAFSSSGYQLTTVSFTVSSSSIGPLNFKYQYSSTGPGGPFTDLGSGFPSGNGACIARVGDFTAINAIDNNPNAVIRLVFTGGEADGTPATGDAQAAGTFQIDNLSINGSVFAAVGTSTLTAGPAVEAATISSLSNVIGTDINFDFTLTDDGATPATDNLPTQMFGVVISQGAGNTITDWTEAIALAQLSNGATNATAVINPTNLTFTGLPNAVPTDAGYIADNGSRTYTLKIALRANLGGTLPTNIDGKVFEFTIQNSGITIAGGSSLALAQSVSSGAARNIVTVDATQLSFTTQPAPININTHVDFTTPPVVRAVDANGNTDLNVDFIATVTNTMSFTMVNVPTVFVAGVLNFPANFQFTSGGAITGISVDDGNAATTNALSMGINVNNLPVGAYRTKVGGPNTDWAVLGNWEQFNGSSWTIAPPVVVPNLNTDIVYILRNFNATCTGGAKWTVGSLYVDKNAILTIDASTGGCSPTPGIEVSVGTKINTGSTIIANAPLEFQNDPATFEIEDNASLNINYNATAAALIWAGVENFYPASTVRINRWDAASELYNGVNITSNTYALFPAAFGNIQINAPALTGDFTLMQTATSNNICHGNITITNANGQIVRLSDNANISTTIGGNVVMNASSVFEFTNESTLAPNHLTVNGSINQSAGTISTQSTTGKTSIVNVNGNISLAGTSLFFVNQNNGTSSSTINLKGNLTVAAGASFRTNDTDGSIVNFNGSGIQLVNCGAAINGGNDGNTTPFALNIKSGATVQLSGNNLLLNGRSTLTVETGGTLDFGYNGTTALLVSQPGASSGINSFASLTGSTLKITSPDGITTTASLGNVQVSASNRTYNQTATFHYIGKSNQITGNAISTGSTAKTIICEMADNDKELTLFNNTSIITPGSLDIRIGKVIETAAAYITGSNGLLKMSGGTLYRVAKGNNTAAASFADPIPRMDGLYTLSGGTIELSGTGAPDAFQTLRGGRTYQYVKYSGVNTLGVDYKNLSSTVTLDSGIILTESAIVDCISNPGNVQSFTGNGGISMDGGRMRFLKRTDAQPELSGIATPYTLTGGVMEFYASAPGSNAGINGNYGSPVNAIEYNQIEVTGNTVANSNSNITLRQGGTFTVKTGGSFLINANAIVGPGTSESVIVENGGTFKCGNLLGFNGPTVGTNSPSVRDNIETIALQPGSTIEYLRASPLSPPDQVITKVVSGGLDIAYQNISFTGTGATPSIKTAPSTFLTVAGNITKSGNNIFAHNNGTVLFTNASAVQSFSNTGTTAFNFYNLTNSNSFGTGLTIANDLGIANTLTLSDASVLNLTTGNITMQSTALATARVAPINTGSVTYNGTGQFIIERNVAALRSWRLLTAPLVSTQTIRQAWMENAVPSTTVPLFNNNPIANYGTHISGPSPVVNGFDVTPQNNYSIRKYNAVTNTWVGTGITPATTQITSEQGWILFVRGDRSYSISTTTVGMVPLPTTLRTRGQLKIGTQPVINPSGYSVVGNPYASAVNFRNITKTLAGAETFYIWDPQIANGSTSALVGGFITCTWNNSNYTQVPLPISPIDNLTGRIESGAAIIVNSANISALNFKETDKATGSNLVFRPAVLPSDKVIKSIRTNLYVKKDDGTNALFDGVMHLFDADFSNQTDGYDAIKLKNFAEYIAIESNDSLLAIERRKIPTENDTIFFALRQLKFRNYTMEFIAADLNGNNLTGYIEDQYTQDRIPLNMNGITSIDFTVSADTRSYAARRFRLVFRKAVTFVNQIKAVVQGANIAVGWAVKGENNIDYYEVERSVDGILFSPVTKVFSKGNTEGINDYNSLDKHPMPGLYHYRIKAFNHIGEIAYSDTVTVRMMNTKSGLYVFPNPVTNGTLGLQFNQQVEGKYVLRLLNESGQVMLSKQLAHSGGTASYNIAYTAAAGNYRLEVTAPNKKQTLLTVQLIR